jgi:hypothetical protein
MTERRQLEQRLERLNALIQEAEARLGAHSVKPVLMQQLFELEEERDGIIARLEQLSGEGSKSTP